ncbi:alpha/beta hydrolase [Pantoea sp. YR343]|uniref:alpha/beta fold hydrolase n=1 Tax=Pantoea sp. YR343 TaxID=1144341 RepID=UPI0002714A2E|nr:alpha/beta hydrolase [Pantoea sp. YR343]KAJ9430786.1 alpha/beta hydrolase [Pantoea sp. YR343]
MIVPENLSSSTVSQTYHWHETRGVNIFYREAGPSDAPTLVLLHGYPSSSRMYAPLIPLISARYHIIAPDYPGFGLSAAPPPEKYTYTFDNLAATMEQFLKEIGVKKYVLFMQDYGGPVGFRMALSRPENIQAIIVQNANVYQEGLGKKWAYISRYWHEPKAHPDQLQAFTSLEGARQRHLGSTPSPDRYNPEEWFQEYEMLSRPGQQAIQASLLYDYQNNVKSYPLWQKWLRDHQPEALILWGKYDSSFIVPGAEAYKKDLPDAEIHILDAGHFALDEANEQVAMYSIKFLDRVKAALQPVVQNNLPGQ